jgi:adenylate cyclase
MISESAISRTRLYTGFVLFAYIAGHLSNLALGLISLDVMNRALEIALAIWGNPLGQVALGGCFIIHFALGLRALFRRRTLRMPLAEAAQLSLGLLIPMLLATHFAGTRYLVSRFGAHIDYSLVLLNLWVVDPGASLAQALLAVAPGPRNASTEEPRAVLRDHHATVRPLYST